MGVKKIKIEATFPAVPTHLSEADEVTRLTGAERARVNDLATHTNQPYWGRRTLPSVIEQTIRVLHDVNEGGVYHGAFLAQHKALEIQLSAILRNMREAAGIPQEPSTAAV